MSEFNSGRGLASAAYYYHQLAFHSKTFRLGLYIHTYIHTYMGLGYMCGLAISKEIDEL